MLTRFAQSGNACVGELIVNGEVIASQAFFETNGTLTAYYSGYLEQMYAYSPVFVIDATLIKEAMSRGVRRVNFLRSRIDWVRRWGAAPGPSTVRVRVVALRPASRLRIGLYLARTLIALQAFWWLATHKRLMRSAKLHLARLIRSSP